MKAQKRLLIISIAALLLLASCAGERPAAVLHSENDVGYIPCVAEQLDIDILSGQAFVYDVANHEFIYKKGEELVVYPASTTKLLTILFALELLGLDEIITPGSELALVASDSSIAYIKSHHRLSVEMLIEGMLLPSGNDAAYALAAAAGKKLAGSEDIDGREAVEYFIRGMNEYAEQIGLCGSRFTSPDGYYNDNHYTTTEDIALISMIASQNEIIMKYAGMKYDNVTYASGHTNRWINTNLMLDDESEFFCEYVTGLKTGSAGAGNYNLICTVTLDDGSREYIIGLFSSDNKENRYRDALKIIDHLIAS